MVIHDEFLRKIFESLGFEFVGHDSDDRWVCDEIDKRVDYGSFRHCYKYAEYEIIISDVNSKDGRWLYQRFNMGIEDMHGWSNSYRNVIVLTFKGIRKSEIGKYKYISEK